MRRAASPIWRSIGSVEVAPSDPNTVYVGTGDQVTGGVINEGNGVKLKIEQETSSISAGATGAVDLVTNNRTITTSVFVHDGDMLVLGNSVVILASHGGDLAAYLASLQRMRDLNPARAYPAHGPVIDDPIGLIDRYLAHRAKREEQVLDALAQQRDTVEAIAADISASARSCTINPRAASTAEALRMARRTCIDRITEKAWASKLAPSWLRNSTPGERL